MAERRRWRQIVVAGGFPLSLEADRRPRTADRRLFDPREKQAPQHIAGEHHDDSQQRRPALALINSF